MSTTNRGLPGHSNLAHASSSTSSSRDPYASSDVSSASDLEFDNDLLSGDPMNHGDGDLSQHISSKQPNKTPAASTRYLHPTTTSTPSRSQTTSPATLQQRRQGRNATTPSPSSATSPPPTLSFINPAAYDHSDFYGPDSAKDWATPPHSSRLAVPYDDLTAIDWIHEYARERSRKRQLHNSIHQHHSSSSLSGLAGIRDFVFGNLREAVDDSYAWIVLVLTGVAVGAIAAGIDVVVEWLSDLKTGVCGGNGNKSEDGGRFWLNRGFCCWGYDDLEQCPDWRSWSGAMGVASASGGWIINFLIYLALSVLFASIAAFLVTKYSLHAKQSGIPEIKTVLGGFVIRRFLGLWTLVIKSLGLCLAVASGLVLGKEGPLVHVACCCANLFMKPFDSINRNEARKREVLSAAAASGISVAFGAPVGGVLFSLEQLSYYFPDKTMWQSFVCAMIAAFTLKAFDPFRTGKVVQYQVTFHTGWHGFEILPFTIIGLLGGLYGGLFIKLNMRLARLRTSPSYPLRNRPILEVATIAALTALVTFPITFLRAQATELDYHLFAECIDLTSEPLGLCKSGIANTGVIFLLLVSSLIAFLFASLTFGLSIPAGILLPSMTIGALYGRVIGLIVEVWQREHPHWIVFSSCENDGPCVTPGTYAIIGAASALAGATRMTVSIVVIMFELTGALTYVLPIMIAVMIAKWVGDAIAKRGIYESWIHFHGYPFLDPRDEDGATVPDVPVAQIMTRLDDLVVLTATGWSIAGLQGLLRREKYRGFPVVEGRVGAAGTGANPDAVLLGYISRTELVHALALATESRGLGGETQCVFCSPIVATTSSSTEAEAEAGAEPGSGAGTSASAAPNPAEQVLDLRPWMDMTPITLSSGVGFQLVVSMFQRLGLRYLLFLDRGRLRGLLTKKDVWFVINEDEGIRRDGDDGARVAGAGVLRAEGEGEERGLLGARDGRRGLGIKREGEGEGEGDDDGGMETGVLYDGLSSTSR